MTSFAKPIVPEFALPPVQAYYSPPKLHCLALYTHSGSKALLVPADRKVLAHLQQLSSLRNAELQDRANSIRLKFPAGQTTWRDYRDGGVQARKTMLDMIRRHRFLCCADLNRCGGSSAGDLFFENSLCNDQVACLTLSNRDKIRIIELPNDEIPGIQSAAAQHWRVERASQKYGVDELKFAGTPWICWETSNDESIRSRRLLMGILKQMWTHGWTRVITANGSVSRYDTDSIVFFRSQMVRQVAPDICCIMLERGHKMRLVGDSTTLDQGIIDTFTYAANNQYRIKEQNHIHGTLQVKFEGQPWMVHSTEDALRTARMFGGVLESMFKSGWEWHCAIDLSVTASDKSSFFFRRGDSLRGAKVGCIQPKGDRKINFVGFPENVLSHVERALHSSTWTLPGLNLRMDGPDLILEFPDRQVFHAYRTDDKIRTISFFRGLLEEVLREQDASFLGTADISGNTFKRDKDSPPEPLDTDVFFFAFGQQVSVKAVEYES